MVPRQLQLEGTLATLAAKNSIVYSGCGTGKTLFMVLPLLLRPDGVSIAISPLKRLQANQVLDIRKTFGISAIAINEDTPRDKHLWRRIRAGRFKLLIVSPEQLGRYKGHVTRFANLLKDPRFVRLVKRVHGDEIHKAYLDGTPRNDRPAFRPAYGALQKFKVALRRGTPFQGLSATLAPHVLKPTIEVLGMPENVPIFRGPLNRTNLCFATRFISRPLGDFQNLDFVIPKVHDPKVSLPKIIIFIDNKKLVNDCAVYINERLPPPLRNKGFVRHYHSKMSIQYLQYTNDDFASPTGTCKILVTTSGASHGIDISDVKMVIQYGLSQTHQKLDLDPTELSQRGGRAGRDGRTEALFLVLAEEWISKIVLDDSACYDGGSGDKLGDKPHAATDETAEHRSETDSNKHADNDQSDDGANSNGQRSAVHDSVDADPDLLIPIDPKLVKSDKITMCKSTIQYIQSRGCLRVFWSKYFVDGSDTALSFTTHACCDRHEDRTFDLSVLLPSQIYASQLAEETAPARGTIRRRKKLRPVPEREPLANQLRKWRLEAHRQDTLRSVRPATHILHDDAIDILSKVPVPQMSSAESVRLILGKTEDWCQLWGAKVYRIINTYNSSIPKKTCTTQAATPIDIDEESSSDEEPLAKKLCIQFVQGSAVLANKTNVVVV